MLSPANVFDPKVSGTQSDATNDNREQDIIETHSHSLTGFQKRSCRTRGGLTSNPPRNEVELGTRIDTRMQKGTTGAQTGYTVFLDRRYRRSRYLVSPHFQEEDLIAGWIGHLT